MERIGIISNNRYVRIVEIMFVTIGSFGGMIGEKW
jgi:hypothetical protein